MVTLRSLTAAKGLDDYHCLCRIDFYNKSPILVQVKGLTFYQKIGESSGQDCFHLEYRVLKLQDDLYEEGNFESHDFILNGKGKGKLEKKILRYLYWQLS